MSIGIFIDISIDILIDTLIDIFFDISIDIFFDISIDIFIGICIDILTGKEEGRGGKEWRSEGVDLFLKSNNPTPEGGEKQKKLEIHWSYCIFCRPLFSPLPPSPQKIENTLVLLYFRQQMCLKRTF